VARARHLRPSLTGINCRDLATFAVDLLEPLRLARLVDWPTRLVFESGIRGEEDALLALSSGFHGILAGEAVMRDPAAIDSILRAFHRGPGGDGRPSFWRKLAERQRPGLPLVKVCGITREEDAKRAADLGADVLGFILAPSPRRVDPGLPARIRLPGVLKAAVVTDAEGATAAARLAAEGAIDAVQFHGEEAPEECFRAAFPYYKALRLRGPADVAAMAAYRCPRVLVDAYSGEARGGTGRAVPRELVRQVKTRGPLWLAGGIGPENVRETIEAFSPELLDASSRLESSPGIKDPVKLRTFFKEMGRG
jgi:indole-3-glycerol phosphate synthase/phosphoribosylanthranilate isomerase